MSRIQLERLKKDLTELETYISKVKKRGNMNLVSMLTQKKEFLQTRIAEAS